MSAVGEEPLRTRWTTSELPASPTLTILVTAGATQPDRYTSPAANPGTAGSDELADVLAEARQLGLVSTADAQLLWLVATAGSQAEVASRLGMTPAALRKRYSRACSYLRAHASRFVA